MRSEAPSFDRGMFTVPVEDRAVRFAFMPPYLNTLNFSEADLRARAGWRLTAAAIRDMREASRSFGAEFIVMFVPFKSQVYLPLVDSPCSCAPPSWNRCLRSCRVSPLRQSASHG
jgi:hypothetical protein